MGGWTSDSQPSVVRPQLCASDDKCQWYTRKCISSRLCTAKQWAATVDVGVRPMPIASIAPLSLLAHLCVCVFLQLSVTCLKYVQNTEPVGKTTFSQATTRKHTRPLQLSQSDLCSFMGCFACATHTTWSRAIYFSDKHQ